MRESKPFTSHPSTTAWHRVSPTVSIAADVSSSMQRLSLPRGRFVPFKLSSFLPAGDVFEIGRRFPHEIEVASSLDGADPAQFVYVAAVDSHDPEVAKGIGESVSRVVAVRSAAIPIARC